VSPLLEVQVRPRHSISSGLLVWPVCPVAKSGSDIQDLIHNNSIAPFLFSNLYSLFERTSRLFQPPILMPTFNSYIYFLHFNYQVVFRHSNYITPPFFEPPKQIPTLRLVRPVHYIPSLTSLSAVPILKCRAITTHIHLSFITTLLYSQFSTF